MVEERKGWKKLTGIAAIIGALSLGSGVKNDNNASTNKTQLEKESIVNVSTGTNSNFKEFYKSENPISWKEYQAKNNTAETESEKTRSKTDTVLNQLIDMEFELEKYRFYTDIEFKDLKAHLDLIKEYKMKYYNDKNKKELETFFLSIKKISVALIQIEEMYTFNIKHEDNDIKRRQIYLMEFQEFYQFRSTMNNYLNDVLKYVSDECKLELPPELIENLSKKTIYIQKGNRVLKKYTYS